MKRRSKLLVSSLLVLAASSAACTSGIEKSQPSPSSGDHGSPATSSTPRQRPPDNNYFPWSRALPRGENAQLAYDNNGEIHTPKGNVPLPNGEGVAFAAVSEGWLVSLHAGISYTVAQAHFGLLRRDGSFVELPMPQRAHLTLAVSPDGKQYLTENDVRNATTGEVESRIPAVAVKQSVRWTNQGLTFLGKGDRPWVWIGSGRPQPLPVKPWGIRTDGWLFKASKTCSTAYQLKQDGTMTDRYRLCGDTRGALIDSASPSGEYGITRDLRVLSLPSGVELTTLEQPGPGWIAYPMMWESDDSIVLWTSGPDGRDQQTGTSLLLRCRVSSGSCERASPVLRDTWPYISFLPFNGYGTALF